MSLNSIAIPTLNITGFTSPLPAIGMLNDDFALYLLQKNIPADKYLKPINSFRIIMVCAGILEVEINGFTHSLSQGALAYLPPNIHFSMKSGNDELNGYMIVLSDIFVGALQIPCAINKDKSFVNYYRQDLSENLQNSINQIFMLIKDEISDTNRIFRREKLINLVSIFYIDILNAYAKNAADPQTLCYNGESGRKVKLSKDFFKLVKQYFKEHRQVNFYADKLCISPKYLSLLIKQTTGKSANEWINKTVILEAKQLLQSSEYSIKEIAYMLNFTNQSFFGKYFKKMVGVSPKDYQRSVELY